MITSFSYVFTLDTILVVTTTYYNNLKIKNKERERERERNDVLVEFIIYKVCIVMMEERSKGTAKGAVATLSYFEMSFSHLKTPCRA